MSPVSSSVPADLLQILDALPVGILMVSGEGRVLHMNKALSGLTGFTAEEARGQPCRHVLRGRPCVAGCGLGCGSFGTAAVPDRSGRAVQGAMFRSPLPRPLLQGLEELAGAALPGLEGIETDLLSRKKRKVPVRLTHFPVQDAEGRELFRLDVLEDLSELKNLEQRLHQARGHGKLVGRSAAMERIAALVPSVAASGAPVLISGETGTGKDILAESLHQASQRSREPFVRLNLSPLPEEMLLPEIFGQSAPDQPERPGRFQQAAGGTLYITDIADLPRGIQARLAAYLDNGGIMPVGALRESAPNVRLITATNRDPEELVRQGILSGELYHRLSVVHLTLPPLRERREDIDFLLRHFLDLFSSRFKKQFAGFVPEARDILAAHDYPGNVRELRNIVEYAAMVCPDELVGVDCLPAHLDRGGAPARKRAAGTGGKNGPKSGKGRA